MECRVCYPLDRVMAFHVPAWISDCLELCLEMDRSRGQQNLQHDRNSHLREELQRNLIKETQKSNRNYQFWAVVWEYFSQFPLPFLLWRWVLVVHQQQWLLFLSSSPDKPKTTGYRTTADNSTYQNTLINPKWFWYKYVFWKQRFSWLLFSKLLWQQSTNHICHPGHSTQMIWFHTKLLKILIPIQFFISISYG